MSDNIFAASSTTGVGSSERIANEFMRDGCPVNPPLVSEGQVLGGLEIKTPRVGTGFIEWAVGGYDLEGKIQNAPDEVNYNKRGDWMYDKNVGQTDDHSDTTNYRPAGKVQK